MGRTTLLQRCARVHVELEVAERKVEELRERKRALVQELYEQDGTGYVYDLGDGRAMILSRSRGGGYFFTPRDKWKKRADKREGKLPHAGHVKTSEAKVVEQPTPTQTPPPMAGGRGEGGTPPVEGEEEDPLEKALREIVSRG